MADDSSSPDTLTLTAEIVASYARGGARGGAEDAWIQREEVDNARRLNILHRQQAL